MRASRAGLAAVGLALALWPGSVPGQGGEGRSGPLTDAEANQLAQDAAAAYEGGDFAAAEAGYRRLLASGRDSAAVYYNLGNSLFRLGRTGPSLLAYERALRRDPSDSEIRENLEFVRGRIVDRVEDEEVGEGDPLRALWDWHGTLPDGVAVAVFLLTWWVFHGCLAGALFSDRPRLRRAAAYLLPLALLGVLATGSVLGLLVYRRDVVAEGIVQPTRVDLLSAPGEGAVRLTTIHEGLKVRLRSRRGDWVEVVLPNGLRGWMPAATIGKI